MPTLSVVVRAPAQRLARAPSNPLLGRRAAYSATADVLQPVQVDLADPVPLDLGPTLRRAPVDEVREVGLVHVRRQLPEVLVRKLRGVWIPLLQPRRGLGLPQPRVELVEVLAERRVRSGAHAVPGEVGVLFDETARVPL